MIVSEARPLERRAGVMQIIVDVRGDTVLVVKVVDARIVDDIPVLAFARLPHRAGTKTR